VRCSRGRPPTGRGTPGAVSGDGASVDVIRRVHGEHARLAVDPTIRMISTSRGRVRKARMRRWNYAPLRHDHRRQSAEIFEFGEVRQAVAERKPKRRRRNAARRSGIAIRLNMANGTYSAA
jgi:hypothetical protein